MLNSSIVISPLVLFSGKVNKAVRRTYHIFLPIQVPPRTGTLCDFTENSLHRLAFLKDSPEKLFSIYEFILQKYAHTSMKRCRNDYTKECLLFLPKTIYDFFEKYDCISVDRQKVVDIKSLKVIDVNNKKYAIIGEDPDSRDLFIVSLEKNMSHEYLVYQISDERHILYDLKDTNSYGTFINFVCFMVSFYSDLDLLELMALEKIDNVR